MRKRAHSEILRSWGKIVLAGVVSGGLALDWYLHESTEYLERCIAAQLRKRELPDFANVLPDVQLLPTVQGPFLLGFLPTMLVGPTGSGKSTLLSLAAREANAKQKITMFIRMRERSSKQAKEPSSIAVKEKDSLSSENSVSLRSDEEACARLDAIAAQMFRQIGFPARRALLQLLLNRASSFSWGSNSLAVRTVHTRDRMATALRMLFAVSAELGQERLMAGISRSDAAPVLLFDEVQDLIRDDRLARLGGRFLFDELAVLLVAYGVDRRVVHAAVAGSSALLSYEFDRTVAAGFRWSYYELQDPDEGCVRDALLKKGYSDDEAAAMIKLCGTRLRLLERPLTRGASAVSAEVFMQSAQAMAKRQLANILRTVPARDARLIADTLDAVLACEARASRKRPELSRSFTERHAELASRVLFLRLDGTLDFQSRLHANVWKHARASLRAA
jgi:energy-coupling factor transporter ATP-binding protein EcfA2